VDNAPSFTLNEKVDAETIAVRREHLMAIQKRISRQKLRQRVGKSASALVEGPSKENELVWEARLEGMAPEIDGKLFLTDIETQSGETARPGDLARVEITKADAYDLIGRVVEILQRRPSVSAYSADVSSATSAAAPAFPAAPVQRISTGAPLRILS
jgi:ribosomal protein S12 methylthiotransferase